MIKIGDRFKTNKSGFCTVIKYINSKNVWVRFEDGTETTCQSSSLRNGFVKNLNYPSVCEIGFIGIGLYSKKAHLRIYHVWFEMLRRCYNKDCKIKWPTYINCTVDKRWHNFQNFCHDYLLMIGSDKNWQLDKDILFKRNKIYSRETCCLVPQDLNKLLVKRDIDRGEFHIGVSYYENNPNPYQSYCHIKGNVVYLGSFKTEQEAYLVYKAAKEAEIKRLANLYKEELDSRVYAALMNYEVEITD